MRSRAKCISEGEKPSDDFCNLENRNFISKMMNKLHSSSGELLTEQNDVINESANHYKTLYTYRETEAVYLSNIINNENLTKLSEEEII